MKATAEWVITRPDKTTEPFCHCDARELFDVLKRTDASFFYSFGEQQKDDHKSPLFCFCEVATTLRLFTFLSILSRINCSAFVNFNTYFGKLLMRNALSNSLLGNADATLTGRQIMTWSEEKNKKFCCSMKRSFRRMSLPALQNDVFISMTPIPKIFYPSVVATRRKIWTGSP